MLKNAKLVDVEHVVVHRADTLSGQCEWLTRYLPGVQWSDTGRTQEIDGQSWPIVRFSGLSSIMARLKI